MNYLPLSDLCNLITDGTHYTPPNIGKGYPFLTVKDISDSMLDFSKCSYISNEEFEKAKKNNCVPQKGDILFSKDGTVGKVFVVETDEEFAVLSSIAILRPKKDLVMSKYLGYLLSSPNILHIAVKNKTGSAIRRIILKDLKGIRMPIPTINYQESLVNKLSKTQEIKGKRKLTIEYLDELSVVKFYEMFGDPNKNSKNLPVKQLKELLIDVQNGLSRRRKISENEGDIVLRLREIRNNYIDFNNLNRIPLSTKEKEKYKVANGDLLFIRVNGNPEFVGRCAVSEGYHEPLFYNDHIMRVKVNTDLINPYFLSYLLNLPYGKKEIGMHRKTSAGQHTISQDGLEKIRVFIPPLSEQNKFIEIQKIIKHQQLKYKESYMTLNDYYNSTLSTVFN